MRAAVYAVIIGLLVVWLMPAGRSWPPTAADIQRDVQLLAEPLSDRRIEARTYPRISLTLVNRSRRAYPMIRPGDGSQHRRRNPMVYFDAEQELRPGVWVPLERWLDGPGCFHYDRDWQKDVCRLDPHSAWPLDVWVGRPRFKFQQPGRVRITGRYVYSTRRGHLDRGGVAGMTGMPDFALSTGPIEYDVVRPLDLRVRQVAPLRVDQRHRLSDVIEVTLTNNSPRSQQVDVRHLMAGGEYPATRSWLVRPLHPGQTTVTLRSGQTVVLLGRDGGLCDGEVQAVQLRTVVMGAYLDLDRSGDWITTLSAEIGINVEPN